MTVGIAVNVGTAVIRASATPPAGFYAAGRLYAVWDDRQAALGGFAGYNPVTGLPEFRPIYWRGRLCWVGPDAEPLRRVCAGRRAWVRRVGRQTI